MDEIDDHIRMMCEEAGDHRKNVHFLQNQFVVIDKIKFIGSTLWFEDASNNQLQLVIQRQNLNDFKHIYCHKVEHPTKFCRNWDRPFMLNHMDVTMLNDRAYHYISSELSQLQKDDAYVEAEAVVVVTHHPPTDGFMRTSSTPSKARELGYYNTRFDMANLSNTIPQLKAWIFGHAHRKHPVKVLVHSVLLLSNTVGYENEFDSHEGEDDLLREYLGISTDVNSN